MTTIERWNMKVAWEGDFFSSVTQQQLVLIFQKCTESVIELEKKPRCVSIQQFCLKRTNLRSMSREAASVKWQSLLTRAQILLGCVLNSSWCWKWVSIHTIKLSQTIFCQRQKLHVLQGSVSFFIKLCFSLCMWLSWCHPSCFSLCMWLSWCHPSCFSLCMWLSWCHPSSLTSIETPGIPAVIVLFISSLT